MFLQGAGVPDRLGDGSQTAASARIGLFAPTFSGLHALGDDSLNVCIVVAPDVIPVFSLLNRHFRFDLRPAPLPSFPTTSITLPRKTQIPVACFRPESTVTGRVPTMTPVRLFLPEHECTRIPELGLS